MEYFRNPAMNLHESDIEKKTAAVGDRFYFPQCNLRQYTYIDRIPK